MRALKSLVLAAAASISLNTYAADVSFDIVSSPGTPAAAITFTGAPDGTITFPDSGGGFDFLIGAASDASLLLLQGNIDGSFSIGAITTAGPVESAPVTGTGTFSIFDGTDTLTADLIWDSVFSVGTTVGLNVNAVANLSNVSYPGTNAGLLSLLQGIDPTITVSTQFLPPRSLSQLMASGAEHSSTYSGSVKAIPEPSSYALLAAGLVAGAIAMRRRVG